VFEDKALRSGEHHAGRLRNRSPSGGIAARAYDCCPRWDRGRSLSGKHVQHGLHPKHWLLMLLHAGLHRQLWRVQVRVRCARRRRVQ
jgi:hypothetical protein